MKKDNSAVKQVKPNVFELLKPYGRTMLLLVVMALLANSINLLLPQLIARGIDDYTAGHFDFETTIWLFVGASAIIFIFTYLQSIVQTYASERVAFDLRSQLSDKISGQSLSFIQQANPSKLLTNLTSDVDSIKSFVSMAVVTIISSVFLIAGTCVMLILINLQLALTVIAVVPVIGVIFYLVLTKVKKHFRRAREVVDKLNKNINETIMGAALVRVVDAQQSENRKFEAINSEARSIGLTILRHFSLLIPTIMFVSNIATVTILALGGHFVIIGKMSLGEFAAFNSYLLLLIFPILMIGFMSNLIAQASASYGRIYEVLHAEDFTDSGTVTGKLTGHIEVKEVSLRYGDTPVLKNISFGIKPGSRTAIIGPTAAGKSQLLYLLTGLLKPGSGEILFDGHSIERYQKENFHHQIGIVFQDSPIFNLTLRENIAFSDKVTDDFLAKALRTAEIESFTDTLGEKLDTVVSERGTTLSGGQKQRIMLARALALNPEILLLDDFTSRVDRATEMKILANLGKNYPDLTLISVTQKISSAKQFDQIILLMEGELIASGTHQELMDSCPEYIQIYQSQRSTQHYEL